MTIMSLFVCHNPYRTWTPQCICNNWVTVPIFCDRFLFILWVISSLGTHQELAMCHFKQGHWVAQLMFDFCVLFVLHCSQWCYPEIFTVSEQGQLLFVTGRAAVNVHTLPFAGLPLQLQSGITSLASGPPCCSQTTPIYISALIFKEDIN